MRRRGRRFLSAAVGINPILPAVEAGLAASVAAVLSVSTPAMRIVYASGRVSITDMIKYGVLMDVVAVTVVPVLFIAPFFIASLADGGSGL